MLIITGQPLQPMECASSTLFRSSLPLGHLLMVGTTVRLDIHQSAWHALSRQRILRCVLHDFDNWQHLGCSTLLRCSFDTYGNLDYRHRSLTSG